METQDKLNTTIGDKEPEKMKAEDVVITKVEIENVAKFGDKVVFTCQHPSREEPLKLSKVKYVKSNKIETSGTWYKEDEDGKIFKVSALAILMNFYQVSSLKDFVNKVFKTELEDSGYLVIKAY